MTHHDQGDPADLPIAEPLRPAAAAPAEPTSDRPADSIAYSTRLGGPSKLRVGVVAGAAVALAVGAVATSLAATPPTSGGATGAVPGGAALTIAADPSVVEDDLSFDHGRLGGPGGFRDITISAISGSSVTLTTDDGWTRTITVTDAVDVTKGGQTIAVSDLKVGDEVRIAQTRNDDGTYTVEAIAVVVPSVHGTVSDVASSGFKVTTRDGSVWTITVNGQTTYSYGTGTGSLADVTNGEEVLVQGTSTADNALTALSVRVAGDRATGTVASKTADTIVITTRDGSSVTVHVDADTDYRVGGSDTATLADVTADMRIKVSGRQRDDGSIDADTVVAGDGGMRGGPGDMGPGMGRGGWGG
ncbi:MAG TPA: DUF5666 domain-containing protein [Candidatus Limnocylindrales bacterium]